MADEHKDENKDELTDSQVEDLAQTPPASDEYPEDQDEEVREMVKNGEVPKAEGVATADALEATQSVTDAPVVETFGAGVSAIQESIEALDDEIPETPADALAHHAHGDTTVLFGQVLPFPIYTVIFFGLGILTLIEVVMAEVISSDAKIPILLGIAIVKAYLVVYYYMHLNTDSRIFAITLALPIMIAVLSALFLFAVDPVSY